MKVFRLFWLKKNLIGLNLIKKPTFFYFYFTHKARFLYSKDLFHLIFLSKTLGLNPILAYYEALYLQKIIEFVIMNTKNWVDRFRGFLPIVIDVETGGVIPQTDALLEVAAVFLKIDENQQLGLSNTLSFHIDPFPGARLDPKSLEFNKIDPYHPFRFAQEEKEALHILFKAIREATKRARCQRAVLVGHNAWFDLLFIKTAAERHKLPLPLHAFTSFDTASLAGVCLGQTVLAKALEVAKIEFDTKEAHSAIYDAEKTAELFCYIVNRWDSYSSEPSSATTRVDAP